ncbi:hypothetical protein [Bifidobacterium felsineum]|uniref:hypothetical protein n=1 Tax=Bifidobacterium felsineum TaxID=2045440 RepID=UPI001BDD3834|nr:hypothetical protein [Bifidobacterium felsineum]MBT1164662.1 hypothetical protein [Bifidobacterium felsineum]
MEWKCVNCGGEATNVCEKCGKPLCMECALICVECNDGYCKDCFDRIGTWCKGCDNPLCKACAQSCKECGETYCEECANDEETAGLCDDCEEVLCMDCGVQCPHCERHYCKRCAEKRNIHECELCPETVCDKCDEDHYCRSIWTEQDWLDYYDEN